MTKLIRDYAFNLLLILSIALAANQVAAQALFVDLSSFASAKGEAYPFLGTSRQGPVELHELDEDSNSQNKSFNDFVGAGSVAVSAAANTSLSSSQGFNRTSVFVEEAFILIDSHSSNHLSYRSVSIAPTEANGNADIKAARQVAGHGSGNFHITLDNTGGAYSGIYAASVNRSGDTDMGLNGTLTFDHPTAQTKSVDINESAMSGTIIPSPSRSTFVVSGGVRALDGGRGASTHDPSQFLLGQTVDLVVLLGKDGLPGETPDKPFPVSPGEPQPSRKRSIIDSNYERLDEEVEADNPAEIIGAFLTSTARVPVVAGGYGNTETIWIDPALAIGYGYSLGGTNRFTSYVIPEPLPQGDDSFQIWCNKISYDLVAGEVFDFTTIDPLGVDSFLLMEIDETELIAADGQSHPPFVYGTTFAQEGVAEVTSFALISIPEPSSLFLASCLGLAAIPRRTRPRVGIINSSEAIQSQLSQ